MTIIQDLGIYKNNHLWIKREDLIPFSFGGNKARKAQLFFQEIEKGDFDCVVTYGTSNSNHCRVIANECCRRGKKCYIISPEECESDTFNRQMMSLFRAKIIYSSLDRVHNTIEDTLNELKQLGYKPYFIEGGGHGNIGTKAYVMCYHEIKKEEEKLGIHFDYIFFATGTGTTQAGLICGQLLCGDQRQIIGISIARKNPRGRTVVMESVKSFLGNEYDANIIEETTIFVDDYTDGYGTSDFRVDSIIDEVLIRFGIPLDDVYTGKAFFGMTEYLKNVSNKNILFIHTGGTPLFFDSLRRRK